MLYGTCLSTVRCVFQCAWYVVVLVNMVSAAVGPEELWQMYRTLQYHVIHHS